MSQEPFLIILGTFRKNENFPKNDDVVRVSFQFLARVLAAVCRILCLTTYLERSFQGPVGLTRAVGWRARNPSKNLLPSLPWLLLPSKGGCEALSYWQQSSYFTFFPDPKIDVSDVSSESSSEAQNPSF